MMLMIYVNITISSLILFGGQLLPLLPYLHPHPFLHRSSGSFPRVDGVSVWPTIYSKPIIRWIHMDSVQTSGEEIQLCYTSIYIDLQLNIQAADMTDLVIRNFRP